MNSPEERNVGTFAPGNAGEAVELFAECSRLKSEGVDIQVGIVESPFRPGRDLGESTSINNIEELTSRAEDSKAGSGITVLVTSKRMANITEISKEDRLAVVEGGVLFSDFKKRIGEEDLFFPYEPWIPREDLTISELIMDNEISDTEATFGGLRESLLSLQMATPGGELIHTGSRAIKDVGGYELAGFILGMGGRCGMVTSATLRLHPGRVAVDHESEGTDPSIQSMKDHRRTLAPLLKRTDDAGGFMHIAYDAGPKPADSLNAIVCRSHYPNRINLFLGFDAEHAFDRAGDLLGRIAGAGLRERIAMFEWQGGALRRRRITKYELLESLEKVSGTDLENKSKDESLLDEMNERVLEVFDPRAIMLP